MIDLAERPKLGNRGLAFFKTMAFYAKHNDYKNKYGIHPLEEFFCVEIAPITVVNQKSRSAPVMRRISLGEDLMKWFAFVTQFFHTGMPR